MNMRIKEKEGKTICLYLDNKIIQKLEYLSNISDMSKSSYIDWLINTIHSEFNYSDKITEIQNDLNNIELQKESLLKKEKEIKQKLNNIIELEKNKSLGKTIIEEELQKKKAHFLQILQRRMINNETEGLIDFANHHSIMLRNKWSAEELLTEAALKIREVQKHGIINGIK